MSNYEWERGTITIPAKEWPGFRTALIKVHNSLEMKKLEQATALHGQLKEQLKGKRGKAKQAIMQSFYAKHLNDETAESLTLVLGLKWESGQMLCEFKGAPKKKDLKILPTTKDCTLGVEDWSITLRNQSRTVTWSVRENNRACERARQHPLAKHLFYALNHVQWTRGSGGKILGNDEYHRDAGDEYEGGGGTYVTAVYGPEQKAPSSGYSNFGGGGPFSPMGSRRR